MARAVKRVPRVTIKSDHGTPVTFPVEVVRLDTARLTVTETTGEHFTVEPGTKDYENVPAPVLDLIAQHHKHMMHVTVHPGARR